MPTTPRKNRFRQGFLAGAKRKGHKFNPDLQYRARGVGFLVALQARMARDEESDTRPRIPHDMSKKGKYVICTLTLESETRPDAPPLASKIVVMPANQPDRYPSIDEMCKAVAPELLTLRQQYAAAHPDCDISMYAESDEKGRMKLYALDEAVAEVGPAEGGDVLIVPE